MVVSSDNLEKLTYFFESQNNVLIAILFGSVAQGTETFNSDVDIAIKTNTVLTKKNKFDLTQRLALLLGRAVDLIDLSTIGEPLLGEIIQQGKCIKKNNGIYVNLALQHLYANEDFVPYLHRSLKERRERWIKLLLPQK